jgi:nucleotide-binding universal stress UspA family protein
VDTAVRLAAADGAQLWIVHVLEDDPQYQPQLMSSTDPQFRAEMEAAGQRILAQASQRAAQEKVSHDTIVEWGAIPEQIVGAALQTRCDVIVMGTRHLTGDKRLMTGRICNAVIATAPCPVLVVPLVQDADGI